MKRLGSMDTSMIFLLAMVIPILAILHSQVLDEKTIFYKWLDSLSKCLFFWCKKHGSVKNVKMGVLLHALASDKDCQLSEYLKHCTCLNVLLMI